MRTTIAAVAIALTASLPASSNAAEEVSRQAEDVVFVEDGKPKLLSGRTSEWKQGDGYIEAR